MTTRATQVLEKEVYMFHHTFKLFAPLKSLIPQYALFRGILKRENIIDTGIN